MRNIVLALAILMGLGWVITADAATAPKGPPPQRDLASQVQDLEIGYVKLKQTYFNFVLSTEESVCAGKGNVDHVALSYPDNPIPASVYCKNDPKRAYRVTKVTVSP